MGDNASSKQHCALVLALISGLFCFISYGTLGWARESFTIEGVCTSDYTLDIGLYKFYQEIETDCGGSTSKTDNTEDMNCDNLSDENCDLLEGAQSSAGTAVAAAVLLLIVQGIIYLTIMKNKKSFTTIALIVAMVIGVILVATAFAATGNFNDLIENVKDEYDWMTVDLGYSWYLMLFAGILGVAGTILSFIAIWTGRNEEAPLMKGNNP